MRENEEMTNAQISLIKKCILAGDECVEVGWINGVNPRTAECLINQGILKEDWPPLYEGQSNHSYVRLLTTEEMLIGMTVGFGVDYNQ